MIPFRGLLHEPEGARVHAFSWGTLGFLTLTPFHRLQLLYVGFWMIAPAYENSLVQWSALVAALLVFLPFYTLLHEAESRGGRLLGLAGAILLALVYVPFNLSGFGIYIFIATALNRFTAKNRIFWRLLGGLNALIVVQALLFHLPLWEMLCAVAASSVAGATVFMQCQTRKADARLRMAYDEIEQLAKTAERERIARDLHDVLGHTLSLISVKSELAARLLPTDPERATRELEEIQITARRALAEVRQTVSGYRAQGLEAELMQVTAALAASGVLLTGRPALIPGMPSAYETSLALIVREAVTNIVRHAGARNCAIDLVVASHVVELTIEDDGRGFGGDEGNGLRGMRERVSELGGTMRIVTSHGTLLQIQVPLPSRLEEKTPTASIGWLHEPAH